MLCSIISLLLHKMARYSSKICCYGKDIVRRRGYMEIKILRRGPGNRCFAFMNLYESKNESFMLHFLSAMLRFFTIRGCATRQISILMRLRGFYLMSKKREQF